MPFDDDDNPTAGAAFPPANGDGAAAAAEEAAEDGMPDYKLFMSMFDKSGVSSKTIRKGEKDFESHGTKAQDSTLEASRTAMEEVLSYTRVHREDSWVRGWYFEDWWTGESGNAGQDAIWLRDRVVAMEHERGNWMKDIGRTAMGNKDQPGVGRMWLLPEEALYLVERGTMDLWWPAKTFEELLPKAATAGGQPRSTLGPNDYDAGLPMTLEAAYSLLIGLEGEPGKTTLPKYQVYTHLKRAGFHILRAPPNSPQPETSTTPSKTLWQWLFSFVSSEKQPKHNSYGPLVQPGLYRAYKPIYQQLALLPRHKPSATPTNLTLEEPFRVHYHLWKPGGTPFSKKNPPPPDFRIAVSDTSDSCLPTLEQMDALLQSTPSSPPNPTLTGPGRMYQRLKHGHRNVLVAVVDRGLVNFMRFGEGAFGEEELFERFDNRGVGRGGKGGRGGRGRGRGGRGRGGRGGRGRGG